MSAIESAFVNSVLGHERERDRRIERKTWPAAKPQDAAVQSKDPGAQYAPRETAIWRMSGFKLWRSDKGHMGSQVPSSISVDKISTNTSSVSTSQVQTPAQSPRSQSPSR